MGIDIDVDMDDFKPKMVYLGAEWPTISSDLAVQVLIN